LTRAELVENCDPHKGWRGGFGTSWCLSLRRERGKKTGRRFTEQRFTRPDKPGQPKVSNTRDGGLKRQNIPKFRTGGGEALAKKRES